MINVELIDRANWFHKLFLVANNCPDSENIDVHFEQIQRYVRKNNQNQKQFIDPGRKLGVTTAFNTIQQKEKKKWDRGNK